MLLLCLIATILQSTDNLCKQFGPRSVPQDRQYVGPDLYPNILKKKTADDNKGMKNYPACKELKQVQPKDELTKRHLQCYQV